MRLFTIDNGLVNQIGHHFNAALGLAREARKRGIDTRFYVNREADEDIVKALDARPAFAFTPYDWKSKDPLCGPLDDLVHLGGQFAADCAVLKRDGVTSDDIVFFSECSFRTRYKTRCMGWGYG